ncbi:MAG TPA: methyltransferase domain-containing protein [Chitinophagaceae bacterium]|nr:methyltransferase domain-containing protein [Chitinophagaceae bacterium]
MNFSQRSYQKELLDRTDIPFEDIKQNMKELDAINATLGGHKITLEGIKMLIQKIEPKHKPVSILEIGCGGGDNLRIIKNYCQQRNIDVELSGVDINPHCIDFARSRIENDNIQFYTSDYKLVKLEKKPDIIFNSLFCHHFADEEVKHIFRWMKTNSKTGFFVNDLHRHPLAYYSIKSLTKLFSKSYLVKNDAPLSVLRGFKRQELDNYNAECSMYNAQLKWKWAFRWLLIFIHSQNE